MHNLVCCIKQLCSATNVDIIPNGYLMPNDFLMPAKSSTAKHQFCAMLKQNICRKENIALLEEIIKF